MPEDIERYWERYSSLYGFEESLRIYREKKAVSFLESLQSRSLRILEVGCGYTPISRAFPTFHSYVALEPGSAPYAASSELEKTDERVTVKLGRLSDWEDWLITQDFDAIVVTGVLHEVDDPMSFLKSIGKLMGRETKTYLNVPNSQSLHRRLGQMAGLLSSLEELSPRALEIEQREVYDAGKLRQQIRNAIPETEIVKEGSFFLKPFSHRQMQSLVDTGLLGAEGLDALYQISEQLPDLGAELFAVFKLGTNG